MRLRACPPRRLGFGGDPLGGAIALVLLGLASCQHADGRARGVRIYDYPAPSSSERYCAWYGDARDGVLYFGQAAFWSAMRTHGGDPTADLRSEGPVAIGRFDLRAERRLEPIDVAEAGSRSGVWDVLAHPNGRVYFTTFYEPAGFADPSTGEVRRLPDLGGGLNELALGPDENLLATRYGSANDPEGNGSVALFDPAGNPIDEFVLEAPDGYRVAPKTVAFDPTRREIWVTTDLLPIAQGDPIRHDAYLLGTAGEHRQRISEPEIQFASFTEDGTGHRAEVEEHNLWLRITAPGDAPAAGRRILLDDAFAAALDFVQDIEPAPTGRVVVTRWSGWVHVVDPSHEVRSIRLPALDDGGLYYSAVAEGDRICATHCAGVSVVCRDIPMSTLGNPSQRPAQRSSTRSAPDSQSSR